MSLESLSAISGMRIKRRVSSQFVESKDEMKRLALGALRRIQKLPKLVRSFFGHNECLYARM